MNSAKRYLQAAQSVYIACHIIPDGDAIGSLLGLGLGLRHLGKSCIMACADPVPAKFDFLPSWREITAQPPTNEEVIVTIDSSDIERLGSLYDERVFGSRPVINIDHHVTNTRFGTVNLVQLLPSTAEIVYGLLKQLKVPLDKDISTALLVGLITDTQCFRTSNVSAKQLRTAIALTQAGASLSEITELVFNREPISTICLWGQALAHVQRRGRILWTEIDQHMMRKCGASPNEGNGLVSFLASTMGVDVAIVFREKDDGRIEVSMRAGPGWDISDVAFRLGGGGHPRAAGCTIAGKMVKVRELILNEIETALQKQAQDKREQSAGNS
nr:bifunctional oligoribonuclease/PAP phosphatase NrnA [Chloroflexota bacterium]